MRNRSKQIFMVYQQKSSKSIDIHFWLIHSTLCTVITDQFNLIGYNLQICFPRQVAYMMINRISFCIVFTYLCCIVSPYLFVLLSIFRGAQYCCVTVTPHGGEQILSWSSLLQRQWTEPDESKIGMLCVDTWFRKLPEKVLIGLDWLFCK